MASFPSSWPCDFVLALLCSLFLLGPASSNVYVVYMGERHSDEPNLLEDSHHQILADILGSKESAKESILYSYKHGFSGFAAVLSQSQAKLIADVPGVVRVVPNRILNLHTTRSWDFLQVRPQIVDGILSKGNSGLGTIIGVMDTGIWPESESFNDNGMRKFPSRWKGICQEGNGFNGSHCNSSGWLKYKMSNPGVFEAGKLSVPVGTLKGMKRNLESLTQAMGLSSCLLEMLRAMGQSFYTGRDANKFHPIVYGADIAASDSDGNSAGSCDLETLNATLARGKVVLCFQSRSQRLAAIASKSVLKVKGVGVIFAQFPTKDVSCPWSFPCVQVDFAAGTSLLTYLAASRNPVVKFSFSKTVIGQQLAPEIAYFSSRGPSSLSPSVLKDEYGQNTVAEGAPHKQADPFDYGGGHVDPNKVLDPGLIYDIKTSDYVCFLYAMGYNSSSIRLMTKVNTPCHQSAKFLVNLNLPSITIPELKRRLTISRTVTNVGPVNSVYVARVQAPAGTDVSIKPWILSFNSTIKKLKFKVTFCSQLKVQGRYSFGNLYWEDGIHVVRIPLIIRIVINNHMYSET
ncbi:hypothetical protein V6N12_006633 [Hibiscus sabdariffa]|uniref:Subtilisin-like protease SBT3.6 n=1 Tax=Hibiscus sabdariffa TaxID=183260 RepID=A0ABR2EZC9_9ROSI